MLDLAVDLLDGPLQADAQTAILKKDPSQSHEKSFLFATFMFKAN